MEDQALALRLLEGAAPENPDVEALRALQDQRIAQARTWLAEANAREDLCLVMIALRPQMGLMNKIIEVSGAAAEVARMHTSFESGMTKRNFCIEELDSACDPGGWFHGFQVQMRELMTTQDPWIVCGSDERTASEILRLCGRASSTAHELLAQRFTAFPICLFRVLKHPEQAPRILALAAEHPCLLDSFSASHLSLYDSPEKLVCQESLQSLALVALEFEATIASVESTHSRNSKRAKHRLTHHMSLPHLAMYHQLRARPRWVMEDPCALSSL